MLNFFGSTLQGVETEEKRKNLLVNSIKIVDYVSGEKQIAIKKISSLRWLFDVCELCEMCSISYDFTDSHTSAAPARTSILAGAFQLQMQLLKLSQGQSCFHKPK